MLLEVLDLWTWPWSGTLCFSWFSLVSESVFLLTVSLDSSLTVSPLKPLDTSLTVVLEVLEVVLVVLELVLGSEPLIFLNQCFLKQ